MDPWKPEIEVTTTLASVLIELQFPSLAPVNVVLCDSGWDNVVYEVNKVWLFRFPQRAEAVSGVEHEMACLPVLHSEIKLVPNIQFKGLPSDKYPWPFFGYAALKGREVCAAGLSAPERTRLVKPLAVLLAKLHSQKTLEKLNYQLPIDPLRRLDFSYRIPMTEERLKKLENLGEKLSYDSLRAVLHAVDADKKLAATSVVHGDLHFRHIIVDEDKNLNGLIDWGDIHLNDPAVDLHLYWSFFPPGARKAFLEAYGAVSDIQLRHARAFAVFINVALLQYSLSQQKLDVIREARFALQNLLK